MVIGQIVHVLNVGNSLPRLAHCNSPLIPWNDSKSMRQTEGNSYSSFPGGTIHKWSVSKIICDEGLFPFNLKHYPLGHDNWAYQSLQLKQTCIVCIVLRHMPGFSIDAKGTYPSL